jgi:hypothetical protein
MTLLEDLEAMADDRKGDCYCPALVDVDCRNCVIAARLRAHAARLRWKQPDEPINKLREWMDNRLLDLAADRIRSLGAEDLLEWFERVRLYEREYINNGPVTR